MYEKLEGLTAVEFEHPFDRNALETLKKAPGLDAFLKWLWKNGREKIQNYTYMASNVQITKNNLPEIYSIFNEARETLNMSEDIKLFAEGTVELNAFTIGAVQHQLILTRGLMNTCSKPQLKYIIGHEMGHIKAGHCLYHDAVRNIASVAMSSVSKFLNSVTSGLSTVVTEGLTLTLMHWQQMSEFTADRAGLLACQDFKIAQETDMILSGFPSSNISDLQRSEWIKQTKEFQNLDYGTLGDDLRKYFSGQLNQSHPFSVLRSAEIIKWMETGGYGDVMSRKTKINDTINNKLFCENCGGTLYGPESFCPICGSALEINPIMSETPSCPKCNLSVQSDAVYCPNCGEALLLKN